MTESKSGVLPLHYEADGRSNRSGRGKVCNLSGTWQPANCSFLSFLLFSRSKPGNPAAWGHCFEIFPKKMNKICPPSISPVSSCWIDEVQSAPTVYFMKTIVSLFLGVLLTLPVEAQIKRERKSLLNSDPDVIYLEEIVDPAIKLKVIKSAPVYADKEGNRRLGFLKADQTVELEGMTDKAYKVRGQGTRNGLAGWVAPWAFSHPQEDFVAKLKELYERQIAVNEIIAQQGIAIGMTLDEVAQSRGKPTKTSVRRTAKGESGTWEFIDYAEVKHYLTRIDPVSGQAYRQLSHVTREEKGKSVVEFEDGLVTALEETENRGPGNVRIIVPPLVLGW